MLMPPEEWYSQRDKLVELMKVSLEQLGLDDIIGTADLSDIAADILNDFCDMEYDGNYYGPPPEVAVDLPEDMI